jgi:hypothetical protein
MQAERACLISPLSHHPTVIPTLPHLMKEPPTDSIGASETAHLGGVLHADWLFMVDNTIPAALLRSTADTA